MSTEPPLRRFKIIRAHTHGDLDPYHEMVALCRPEDFQNRDSLGRKTKNGWRRWMRVICNNPDCEGEVWVSMESVAQEITEKANVGFETSFGRGTCPIEGCEARPYTKRPVCSRHKKFLSMSERTRLYDGTLSLEEAIQIIERKERQFA